MSVIKAEIETYFGRCRCCLSYGYLKNMWAEHQFEGEAEIYGEMLVQCFALTWDHSEHSMEQDQICEQCIYRLRDASDFKRVVLDSQAELFQQIEAENELSFKEERLDEEFLIEYQYPGSEDADTMYSDTKYTMDTADTVTSVKDETEYEEVEYLEEEDAGGANDAVDTDYSQPTEQLRPAKRRKQPRKQDTDDQEGTKRKWPRKLPKSERHRTYKQYSEIDLRKCLEDVRNNVLTATEAALKYDIPKKTICAKIKENPNDVRTDIQKSINNTTTREAVTTSQIEVPILSHEETIQTDTESQEVTNKYALSHEETKVISSGSESQEVPYKYPVSHEEAKVTDSDTESQEVPNEYQLLHKAAKEIESEAESQEVLIKYPILDEEAKKTNSDTESQGEVPNKIQMLKHKNNLKMILKYSNATLIKGNSAAGYSCWFCDKYFNPEKLKKHNFQHGDVYDDAIKVKYVSDLIIKLDVTGLQCRLCEKEIDSLEQLMGHFQEILNKTIYTDIDNHFVSSHTYVQIDNTTNTNYIRRLRKRPTSEIEATKVTETIKDRKSNEANLNVQEGIENIKEPSNPDDHRFMYKHKANIKTILQHSNATLIKSYGRDGYSCNFCDFQAEKPFVLKRHNLNKHTDVGDEAIKTKYVSDLILKLDITDFKCNLCKGPMKTLEEFMGHLSKIHSKLIYTDVKNYIIPFKFDSADFGCFMCDKNFMYFKLLSEHMTEHYRNFDCPDCDRSFINKQSMQSHIYRHNRGIFKCSYCSKEFDSRPKRADHERAVHMAGKYRKCAYCDRRFPTLDAVLNHELKAHGVAKPQHTCEDCGKTFSKQSGLTMHKNRFHLFKKPHKCSYCEMAFCTKVELNYHIITHTKTRNHSCNICKKSFGTPITLSQHMRTHEGVKKLLCDYCNRRFLHRTSFRRHMRDKHGEIV